MEASVASFGLLLATLAGAALAQTSPVGQSSAPAVGSRGVKILEATEDADQSTVNSTNAAEPAHSSPPIPPGIRPIAAPVVKACPRPLPADLTFDGSPSFDRLLGAKLRGGQRVVVDVARPWPSTDAPPSPLATWLGEVGAGKGTVSTVEYCTGRGAFGDFLSHVFRRDPKRAYRPVRGYDAVLHANAMDKVVTQIEFAPRSPAAS